MPQGFPGGYRPPAGALSSRSGRAWRPSPGSGARGALPRRSTPGRGPRGVQAGACRGCHHGKCFGRERHRRFGANVTWIGSERRAGCDRENDCGRGAKEGSETHWVVRASARPVEARSRHERCSASPTVVRATSGCRHGGRPHRASRSAASTAMASRSRVLVTLAWLGVFIRPSRTRATPAGPPCSLNGPSWSRSKARSSWPR